MTRAGLYIRKSRQDKGQEAYRLELQRTKLPAYAREHGWVYEAYDDGIISGSAVETRRQMVRMIGDLEAGRLDVILCIEFSRLSRDDSLADFLTFLNLCASKGVKLATPERTLDPSDTASWFLAIIEGGFSAVEMKTLKKRIRDGQQMARSKGRWLGGNPPFGFSYDRSKKRLLPHPETAEMVRTIFHERVVKGKCVDQIVRLARDRGWPTARGGIWVSSSVHNMLKNPIYAGLTRYNGKLIKAASEPLVDQETWNAAQQMRVRPPGRRTPSLLLTGRGRVRCGYCGSPVNCSTSYDIRKDGTKGKVLRYYHCYGRHRGVPCKALRNVPNWELEGLVLGVLSAIFEHKDEILDGMQKHLEALQGELPEQRKRLDAQLRHVLVAENKLLQAYEAGAITLEQLKARNESNRQQTDAIQKDIMALDLQLSRQGAGIDRAELESRLARFSEQIPAASLEDLRAVVEPLVSQVLLYNEKAEVFFSFPLDGEVKHEFALLGKGILKDFPRTHFGIKERLGEKERELLEKMPLGGMLADPSYKLSFARATPS